MINATLLCQEIESRRLAALAGRIAAYPRSQPIASDLGPCVRETALAIVAWRERPLVSPELKARFERGSLIEDAVLRELSSLGLSVRVERRPFELTGRNGRVILRGRVDGFIQWEDGSQREYPLEVKSLDPNIFRRITCVEDFRQYSWAAKWPRQVQAYLYAHDLEEGLMLLDDCEGHWRLLPIQLDYDEMERILQQCEAAVEAVERVRHGRPPDEALPPYHADPAECRRCWAFGRVCFPPAAYDSFQVFDEPELEAKLDRRAELEPLAREYDALDREVKAAVKGKDGLVVGQWLVRGREITSTYKAQPERVVTRWQTTFERIGL